MKLCIASTTFREKYHDLLKMCVSKQEISLKDNRRSLNGWVFGNMQNTTKTFSEARALRKSHKL